MIRINKEMGVSQLRLLSADELESLEEPLVISKQRIPVAVLVPYKTWILINGTSKETK